MSEIQLYYSTGLPEIMHFFLDQNTSFWDKLVFRSKKKCMISGSPIGSGSSHIAIHRAVLQWRIHKDFRMGGVEVPQAPRGSSVVRGYPPPHWGRVWEDGCAPPQKIFRIFC